jgi:hypothetical protein
MIFTQKPNLAEAHATLAKLLPNLAWPRLSEYMSCCDVALPRICDDENLVFLEQPETLISSLGPFVFRKLPKQWLPAYHHHRKRLARNAQMIRLLPLCLAGELAGHVEDHEYAPDELDDPHTDGIVAGLILLAVRPMPGPLRTKLISLSKKHWFGSFLALHGVVFENEAMAMLGGVACDARLTAGIWKANPDIAAPLVGLAMRKNDVWSGIIALNQPLAEQWLGRVTIFAERNSIAAVTALVLQPGAPAEQKAMWAQRLKRSHSRLAYIAVRWARHTWPTGWEALRDELREHATADRGQIYYHWYRDCEPERIDSALRQDGVDTLWMAELVNHAKNSGQELRRRMAQQLKNEADNREAVLTLRWLERRGRIHD